MEWETVFQTPWFSVRKRDRMHVIDERNGRRGAAALPLLSDGRVVLVEQYRQSLDRLCLEAPRGFARDGESAEDCARRELQEETGIAPEGCSFDKVGQLAPNSGLLSTEVSLFLARAEPPRAGHSTAEVTRVVTMTLAELIEGIRAGKVTDGFTIALALHASHV